MAKDGLNGEKDGLQTTPPIGQAPFTFMKKFIITMTGSLVILLVIGGALFWLRMGPATTRVEISGNAGSQFTGSYVRDGQRVTISGVLPWSFQEVGISEFEFRKVHPEDSFTFKARYEEPNEAAEHVIVVPPGALGLRDKFHHHGMSTAKL